MFSLVLLYKILLLSLFTYLFGIGPFPCLSLLCSTRLCQETWLDVCLGNVSCDFVTSFLIGGAHTADLVVFFLFAYLLLAQMTNIMNVGVSFSVLRRKDMCCCFYCLLPCCCFIFVSFLAKKKKREWFWHLFVFKLNRFQSGFLCWNLTVVWRLVNKCPYRWITNSGRENVNTSTTPMVKFHLDLMWMGCSIWIITILNDYIYIINI